MKTLFSLLISILVFFNITLAQPLFLEQISGVSTPLNYVYQTGWSGTGAVSIWICGDNGVVLKSTNTSGGTWINVSGNGIPNNINLNTITSSTSNSTVALTCGVSLDTAIVYRTTNAGANWQVVFRQYQGSINGINFTNNSGIMIGNPVGGRWSIWKSSNEGANWDSTGLYLPRSGSESGFRNSFGLSLVSSVNYLLFGTNNSRLYYSTNQGTNWLFASVPIEQNISAFHFPNYFSPNNLLGYIGGSSHVMFTSNSGVNWVDGPAVPGIGNVSGLVACQLPVAFLGNFEVMITRNDSNVYRLPYSGNNWLVAYSAPSGKYRFLTNKITTGLFSLFAVRDNGGISWGSCGTAGITQISTIIPKNFSLSQNYPNPFNPATKIEFDIPVKSLVRISIFDITGKEITRIFEDNLYPGGYRVDWDASKYSSGIYFYSMIATNERNVYSETKKMILVR